MPLPGAPVDRMVLTLFYSRYFGSIALGQALGSEDMKMNRTLFGLFTDQEQETQTLPFITAYGREVDEAGS